MKKIITSSIITLLSGVLISGCQTNPTPNNKAINTTPPIKLVAPEAAVNNVKTTNIQVFFNNKNNDPDFIHCEKVYPVVRTIPSTKGIGLAALKQLILGPTSVEKQKGFSSVIPTSATIESLEIKNQTAHIKLGQEFNTIGGSCGFAAYTNSIEKTLQQFPTVDTVKFLFDEADLDL